MEAQLLISWVDKKIFIGVAFELDLEEWLGFWWFLKMQENVSEQEIDQGFEKGKYMYEGRVWFITIECYLKKINR